MIKIKKHSIVKFMGVFYRVKSESKGFANLCNVFGGEVIHWNIALSLLLEAYEEWFESWNE